MAGIHRTRPGASAIRPAVAGEPASEIGDRIWMSPGVSYSYAIGTDAGRVVLNAGLNFEGRLRRAAYDVVCPGTTEMLIFTQGHADHVGGFRGLVDPATELVSQANYKVWRDDHHRLASYRVRNAMFAWSHTIEEMIEGMGALPADELQFVFPEPTQVFEDELKLAVGGRRIELFSTPGGETTDALVVWLPDERTVFTGNLFGPLFGHVPNLVTIRGDRYRDPLAYVDAANLVLSLGAEKLVTGHFDPIVGADLIATEVTALRDSTQWLHDHVIEQMEAGTRLPALMDGLRLPEQFDVGEGYGKASWNARAIWEMYSGWFHHESTTELYGVPVSSVAADIAAAAGVDALVAAARARTAAGEPVAAIHLLEIVLEADPRNPGGREVAAAAHQLLHDGAENFWERAWLARAVEQFQAAPEPKETR